MNGRIASAAYLAKRFQRRVRWSSGSDIHFETTEFCYSDTASAAEVLASASDTESCKAVSDQALTMFVEGVGGKGRTDNLLYIMREADHSRACKIGYACKPEERLASLQIGTWRKLKIEAVFCPVQADIIRLERAIHLAARRRRLTIIGEWISATPIEATALILEFARKKDYSLCGGDRWFENLGARVAGLREAQLERRRQFEELKLAS